MVVISQHGKDGDIELGRLPPGDDFGEDGAFIAPADVTAFVERP